MTSKKQRKVPELRFRGFTDDWEQRKLSSIVTRVTRKNTGLVSDLPLTISAQDGLVDQVTYFNKRVASKNMEHYLLLLNGEFAYNKSYSKDYPWGAIKRLDMYPRGALSTLYIAFKPTSVNSEFLVAYYETSNWYKQVSERAAEGARNHGLLNIAPHDFFDTRLLIPKTDDEQRSIGLFIKKLDHTIALHQREQSLLEKLKQGYLQKLFPQKGQRQPELRFSGFTDDWEQRKLGDIGTLVGKMTNPQKTPDTYFLEYSMPAYDAGQQPKSVLGRTILSGRIQISGDVLLINKLNVRKKRIWLVKNAPNNAVSSSEFMPFRAVHVDSAFLGQLMSSNRITRLLESMSSGTSNSQKRVTPTGLLKLIVRVPFNLKEQRQIAVFFNHLDYTIALHQQEIDRLQQLKQGYLQKMFV